MKNYCLRYYSSLVFLQKSRLGVNLNSVYGFMHSSEYVTLAAGLMLFFAILSQYCSWRFKLPSILFLILSGVFLGPVSELFLPGGMKLVNGSIILGQALYPFISICVAIILFEGSLSLNFSKIKNVSRVVFLLVTLGAGITVVLTALFCHYVLGLDQELSLLIGGVTCVSGPTVVPPLMRTIRPKKNVANILKWESIVVDPIGALVVVFMMVWFFAWDHDVGNFIIYMFFVCLLGLLLGWTFGYFMGHCFRRHYIPEYLKSLFVLSVTVVGFIISDSIMHGAGLLMVTVAGIVITNMKDVKIGEIISFKENLSIVIISVLFIMLSADIDFSLIKNYWGSLIVIFFFLQFIVRPLVVFICSFRSEVSFKEKIVMGLIYPRGIVAASVAALVAAKLVTIDVDFKDEANLLVFFVFMVIVLTVIFQSVFVPPISRWLGVSEPEGKGFLIIGGNKFARELGAVFAKRDIEVVITDSSWTNAQKCRQLGLNTYYGSPVSVNADWNLSLDGIGSMLGLSTSEYVNTISAVKYARELGASNIYVVRSTQKESYKGTGSMEENYATQLFDEGVDSNTITEKLNNGYRIKSTRITKTYTFDRFISNNKEAIPLFTIDDNDNVRPFMNDRRIKQANYILISLKE